MRISFRRRSFLCRPCAMLIAAAAIACALVSVGSAEVITLKNGYQLEGKVGRIAAIAENPLTQGDEGKPETIVLVDDELRRIFVPFAMVQANAPDVQRTLVRIPVEQRVAMGGARISSVGVPLRIEPFDEFGRRTFSMQTAKGPIHVIQGITEVTPIYTKLEGLVAEQSYVWTTKIATSSIPAELLSKILRRQAGDDVDQRLKIVRLYIESERYSDARAELEACLKDFPDLANVKRLQQGLAQESTQRMVKEIELRRDSGQHQLAIAMASNFPADGVAGETLLKVRDILTAYEDLQSQGKQVLELFDKHLAALPDDKQKTALQPIREEIASELSVHNIERMADYLRLADDESLKADQKLSLAVSGWFLGKGEATENLSVAIALYDVRNLVRKYLRSTHAAEREQILMEMEKYEGSAPTYVARILAHMKPPIETEPDIELPDGMFKLQVPGLAGEPDITYFVQLPPEYNPYRRYPAVVTLSGLATPEQQINWWAGDYDPDRKMRMGQAARRGYIVIAPVWSRPHQSKYEYSVQEHAAVLFSVRDAFRRFSIDTNRVYLSGHSMGGEAAWDIALSHPDLWAGVIPIGASANKYIQRYYSNGKYVPLYYVAGEMDGDRFLESSIVLDKYLKYSGYDAIIVQYQGRGHEHFYDEIQNIFNWMDIQRRNPLPKEFECDSLRPWDNYFWWVEVDNYPANVMVLPALWPPKRNAQNATTKGRINSRTSLTVQSSASRATIYLTPEMVDFESRFTVKFNARDYNFTVQPSNAVLLEDARTRGDRLHPFWQKVAVGR